MKTEILSSKLKGIFPGYIKESEIEGGQYIEDTSLYKTISSIVSPYKPKTRNIEPFAFEFALKLGAIEFYKCEDHGFYHAESYQHYFEDSTSLFATDYIDLLNHHGLLPGFKKENIEVNMGIVKNLKTQEFLTLDTIEKLGIKWIMHELTIQINTIKLILSRKENRNRIIRLIAGNEKPVYVSNADKIFEDIIQL